MPSSSIVSFQPSVCSWNCAESACFSGCFIPCSCHGIKAAESSPTLDSKLTCTGSYRMLKQQQDLLLSCEQSHHSQEINVTTKEDCSYATHHGHLPRTGRHRVQSNPGLRAEQTERKYASKKKHRVWVKFSKNKCDHGVNSGPHLQCLACTLSL